MNELSMFNSADGFLDLIIIAAGGYLMYAALIMKVAGKIPSTLISRNVDPEKASNKEEYIKNMFIPSLIMGLILVLSGLSNYILPAIGIILPEKGPMIISIVSMAIVIIFGIYSMNMQKKYLRE